MPDTRNNYRQTEGMGIRMSHAIPKGEFVIAEEDGSLWDGDGVTMGGIKRSSARPMNVGVNPPLPDVCVVTNIALTTTDDYVLSAAEYCSGIIILTGSPGGITNLVLPTILGANWWISNKTDVTIKPCTLAGTLASLVTLKSAKFFCDGTDIKALTAAL